MTTGFTRYLLFIIRRERISSFIWIVSLVFFNTLIAVAYTGLFENDEAIQAMVGTLSSPEMQSLMGPIYGPQLYNLTTGHIAVVFAQQLLIWMIIPVIIMNIFFITRHTRADEELGRLEMLRSLPMGRMTVSAAALTSVFILNLIISVFMAIFLIIVNIPGTTVSGSIVYSFVIGASGFLFACITLLTAQLFQNAKSTVTWAFVIFGVFYAIRAYGDMLGSDVLNHVSPLGLSLRVFAFWDDNIYPIFILLAESVLIAVVAFAICVKRDVGEGVVPAKSGRHNASRFLQSPLGLAWRLSKSSVLIWVISMFAMGAVYGAVLPQIGNVMESNEMFSKMIISNDHELAALLEIPELREALSQEIDKMTALNFVEFMYIIMAILASVPVIITACKIHGEEKRGRLEAVFARSVSRNSMLGGFILISAIGSVIWMFAGAFGIYAVSASMELVTLSELLQGAFAYVPALWVMMSISVLLVGFVPKCTGMVWVVFGYSFFTVYFGRMMDLPEWCAGITPYGNVPPLKEIIISQFNITPIVIISVIAIILTSAGFLGFSKRDINRV